MLTARAGLLLGMLGVLLAPDCARATGGDNALTTADDAFGTTVGKETSGIYTDKDTRGFSPIDAGNARIEGLYYDPVATLPGRLRESTSIRVGFAALGYPFNAPTGVADYHFRPFPTSTGASVNARYGSYGDSLIEADLRLPMANGKIGLTGGIFVGYGRKSTGYVADGNTVAIRPIFRLGFIEFAPFAAIGRSSHDWTEPLTVVRGAWLPSHPGNAHALAQEWTAARRQFRHFGATLKAPLTDKLRLDAGLFRASERRITAFTDIYVLQDATGLSDHYIFADPQHETRSTSGEARLVWTVGGIRRSRHRLVAAARFRDRLTESGGTDIRYLGKVHFGEPNLKPEPALRFGPIASGRVRQSAVMLGYLGDFAGGLHLNLGLQRGNYRSSLRSEITQGPVRTDAHEWLYNAVARVDLSSHLSAYAGVERGLEDSGSAPETAANRHEQLPATITRQYEGGLRWTFSGGTAVISAFQITKPYFTYDLANVYTRLGTARLRGVEGSITYHPSSRLSLLAGFVALQARVSGDGVEGGQIGRLPAGKPNLRARADGSYRTNLLGGFEPTFAFAWTGRRAAGSAPQPLLGGRQLMAPGFATVDIGFRQPFTLGGIHASLRANLENAFDAKSWKVVAPNTVFSDERRRVSLMIYTQF